MGEHVDAVLLCPPEQIDFQLYVVGCAQVSNQLLAVRPKGNDDGLRGRIDGMEGLGSCHERLAKEQGRCRRLLACVLGHAGGIHRQEVEQGVRLRRSARCQRIAHISSAIEKVIAVVRVHCRGTE